MYPYEYKSCDANGVAEFEVIPGRRYTGMIHGIFSGGTISISEKLPEISADLLVVSTNTSMVRFDIVTAGSRLIFTKNGDVSDEIIMVVKCPLGV